MRVQVHWQVPKKILDDTENALSSRQSEVFVLWAAALKRKGNIIKVTRLIVPKQTAYETPLGCYVRIEGDELSKIDFDNYDRGKRNVAQLHTHPSSNVNMSSLDRKWEVVFHTNALSIVVPNYCKKGLNGFSGINVYEKEVSDWRLWQHREILRRLSVIK
jgi:proteasome lid subunit RPN8/RPN11